MPDLSIRWNNAATNDPCAICGQRTDPEVGPELFVAGTWAHVCRACGRNHAAPGLVALLDLGHAARIYCADPNDVF